MSDAMKDTKIGTTSATMCPICEGGGFTSNPDSFVGFSPCRTCGGTGTVGTGLNLRSAEEDDE